LRYAEVEKELAYLEAFDTVGEEFFRVYTVERPLRSGYEYRRLFYWLNTYMTHVWLGFGPGFRDRIAATCDRIIAMSPTAARRTQSESAGHE
jgi:fructosamine-3-kinase